jgi:hypothetical protein
MFFCPHFVSETERGITHLQRQLENREKELTSERNLRRRLEKQVTATDI